MIELVRLYHPKVYVEIGVAAGHTFKQMMQMPQIDELHAVDILPMNWLSSHRTFSSGSSSSGSTGHRRITRWVMDSQEFAKTWKGPIDMLFIDGDHNKETVEHDFFEIGKFVRTGTGLILMHDTHPMMEYLLQPEFCNNAWEFADWLHMESTNWENDFEVLTLPGPWAGLTIVKKRGSHHLCWKNEDRQ